jgi:hypothetical protein
MQRWVRAWFWLSLVAGLILVFSLGRSHKATALS